MANSFNSGIIYLDTASEQAVVIDRRIKIKYAVIIPNAAADVIELSESSTSTNPSIVLKAPTNGHHVLDFSRDPIVMNGIYTTSIAANAVAILYTTSRGGGS